MSDAALERHEVGQDALARRARPAAAAVPVAPAGGEVGFVVRDAIDHAHGLVSDSVALGRLEAKRAAAELRREMASLLPRAALAFAAAFLGIAGLVLGVIAFYVALRTFLSAAACLALFALGFVVLAACFGVVAARWRVRRSA